MDSHSRRCTKLQSLLYKINKILFYWEGSKRNDCCVLPHQGGIPLDHHIIPNPNLLSKPTMNLFPFTLQPYLFNWTYLGNVKIVVLLRCHIFKIWKIRLPCHNNEALHENSHYTFCHIYKIDIARKYLYKTQISHMKSMWTWRRNQ